MLYDNILVPYDGSTSAQAALAEAVRYARDDPGATLRIIQIIDMEQLVIDQLESQGRDTTAELSSVLLQAYHDEAVTAAGEALHRQIDGLIGGLMNKVVIELLEETVPGEQIVQYASDNNCDLIIMGSRGLGALRGILGSVSSYVLRNADLPVLIVKRAAEE